MFKIGLVFPGQGSQYVGMGKEFYDNFPVAKEIFEQASESLGFDIASLCFSGPENNLKETVNAQPAILTVSIACWEVFKKVSSANDGWLASAVMAAGHSLGEYSALVAVESIEFKEAVRLVRRRGELMQEAAEKASGGMVAILGLERGVVERICEEAKEFGWVSPANYNCPGQVVISGENEGLRKAIELAEKFGAKRCVRLEVSGPFHSTFMKGAGSKLSEELDKVTICDPKIPLVANVSADLVKSSYEIKEALIRQISSPVLWEDCIGRMLSEGIKAFIEIGPGKVLSGLIKRIDKDCQPTNVEDMKSLQETIKILKSCSDDFTMIN